MIRKTLTDFAAKTDDEIAAFSIVETASLTANVEQANAADARIEAAQKAHDDAIATKDAEKAAAVADVQAKLDAAQAEAKAVAEQAASDLAAVQAQHDETVKARDVAQAQVDALLNQYDAQIQADAKAAAIAKAHADEQQAISAEAAAIAAKAKAKQELADLGVVDIVPVDISPSIKA